LYAVFIVLNSPTLGGIVRTGLVAAMAVAVAGWTLERVRFGASDAEAIARVEAETQQRFNVSAERLETLTARTASQRDLIRAASRDAAPPRASSTRSTPRWRTTRGYGHHV
jgi:hypothetical protein